MNRMNALLFIIGSSLMSCTSSAEEPAAADNNGATAETYTQLVSKTRAYPDSYEQEATQRGTIVTIDYDTRDYADGAGAARTNTAQVYLPYGYSEDTARRYNVLYLVHGHYGNASTYFATDGGLLRKVLDNMIEHGDIEPLIVVTPTYNYGQPTADYVDADKYCKALPLELKNELIPLVESRYRTYAQSSLLRGESEGATRLVLQPLASTGPSAVSRWVASPHGMPSTRRSASSATSCLSAATAGRSARLPA